jgi:hypothetical protein
VLLSFLHRAGDVENCAAGAVRVHRNEGTRKERRASGFVDDRLGRNVRESGKAAMIVVGLSADSCRCNATMPRSRDGFTICGR